MAGQLSVTFRTISRCLSTLVVCTSLMLMLTSSFADNNNSDSNVMILTTKNFDSAVAETEHLFVQFCA